MARCARTRSLHSLSLSLRVSAHRARTLSIAPRDSHVMPVHQRSSRIPVTVVSVFTTHLAYRQYSLTVQFLNTK